MPVSEVTSSGPKESGLGALVDDSPQKKHLAPKATPPPSPLLSELLKKGSLIAASSRLVSACHSKQDFGCVMSQAHFIFLNPTFVCLFNANGVIKKVKKRPPERFHGTHHIFIKLLD